jgi:trehalose 6-phosphate synthase
VLLETFFAYDLVGLQTDLDHRAFRGCMTELAGADLATEDRIRADGRTTRAGVFPVGIDGDGFARMAATAANSPETARLRDSLVGRKLIIGVDRLDYSKGLINRFRAYDRMLELWPEHRAKVTLLQIAARSRDDVASYRALRRELEHAAGRTNGRFAEFDWVPIRYVTRALPRNTLAGFFRASQVGLVTPLRDGMNLVAKEYVAAQPADDPGVLVLSRFAGAAREFGAAIQVNPYDLDDMAECLHRALVMPLEERRSRWAQMMESVRRHSAQGWSQNFLRALAAATSERSPKRMAPAVNRAPRRARDRRPATAAH